MGVGEYDVYHMKRAAVVPVFNQALLVRDEYAYLVPTWNVCSSADGWRGT